MPVAEMSTRVHSTGKIRSKFLKAFSRWSSFERSKPGRVAATMTTSSSNRSGSFHVSRFETSSAPLMKYQSSPGERSLRIRTVSTLCMARPASTSILSTENRSLSATAASTMSNRSSAEARTLEASLWGGMPPGTNATCARSSSPITCSAMIMCPWWMGSKVPPKIPTFKLRTSPEIERRLADPDLVARLCAGAPQGAHDAPSLELPLEARHAFGILPVRLEGEPLHALAGYHVGAVLALHAHALPRRAEHAMLAGALLDICCVLRRLAQPLIQEVLELDYALASHCGDLDRALERFSQVPSKLLVQEVNLVQDGHGRLSGEPGGVQLRPEDPRRPFRVLARIQNQRQEPRARHVPQETVAQTPACARPRDEPGDVRDHERFPVGLLVHHPELRRERGERVVAYPGTGGAQSREQRRLAGVGQPHEPDVREHLELQAYLLLLARQTPLAEGGRLAGRGSEGCVPSPALATTGHHERLLGLEEVGEQAALVVDLGTDWN